MLEYDEKREYIRMSIDCDIIYKLADSDQESKGRCTSLSGAGISFISDQVFEPGKSLEVNVIPKSTITPPMTALIEVVRHTLLKSGDHEIAASIKSIIGTS